MSDPLGVFWVHDCMVRRLVGDGAYGPEYAAPTTDRGNVAAKVQMVRDTSGDEVVSSTSVAFPLSVADVPPGSEVQLPAAFGSRTSKVVAVSKSALGEPFPDTQVLYLE
ncbi:hypothetical protein [Nocardia salmonicida]|uniref:hypothetical protein n=1 Tax=Nocardia salmonicida TaxID=53431 RepID=UPI00363DD985